MPSTFKSLILALLITFSFLFCVNSITLNADPVLKESELEGFAKACSTVVYTALPSYFEDKYRDFGSEIEDITSGGADVSIVIQLMRAKSIANNGWGSEVSNNTYEYFECVFYSVERGVFPPPVFFLRYKEKNISKPWVIVENSGYGYKYGICEQKLLCKKPFKEWTPINLAPENMEFSHMGNRVSSYYQLAKKRAPKQWIWEQIFEEKQPPKR